MAISQSITLGLIRVPARAQQSAELLSVQRHSGADLLTHTHSSGTDRLYVVWISVASLLRERGGNQGIMLLLLHPFAMSGVSLCQQLGYPSTLLFHLLGFLLPGVSTVEQQ